MAGQGEIRRRKKDKGKGKGNNKGSKTKPNQEAVSNTNNNNNTEEEEEDNTTLFQVFWEHPLIVVLRWFALPYLAYRAYYFFLLQRPDLLVKLGIPLRPAVGVNDPRPLLILGSMSSGTIQVAHDLSSLLKLEMGHETANSQQDFCRDGTVSWFHVLRYLPPPKSQKEQVMAYAQLCHTFTPSMGFHPAMYRPSKSCSQRLNQWDKCWTRECYQLIQQEWGCALRDSDHDSSTKKYRQSKCLHRFDKVLHQVRHPLRTIESLVRKFCHGTELDTGVVSEELVKFATVLFPDYKFNNTSCVEAAAHYVLAYNHALLQATEQGLVDGRYSVETTSPCDIARMAGFMTTNNDDGVIYPPHRERIAQICSTPCDQQQDNQQQQQQPQHCRAQQAMTSTQHKINHDVVQLTYEDLRGGKHGSQRPKNDNQLEEQIRHLVKMLGYDDDDDSDA